MVMFIVHCLVLYTYNYIHVYIFVLLNLWLMFILNFRNCLVRHNYMSYVDKLRISPFV